MAQRGSLGSKSAGWSQQRDSHGNQVNASGRREAERQQSTAEKRRARVKQGQSGQVARTKSEDRLQQPQRSEKTATSRRKRTEDALSKPTVEYFGTSTRQDKTIIAKHEGRTKIERTNTTVRSGGFHWSVRFATPIL